VNRTGRDGNRARCDLEAPAGIPETPDSAPQPEADHAAFLRSFQMHRHGREGGRLTSMLSSRVEMLDPRMLSRLHCTGKR
jgi:hypothetical protein